MREIVYFSSIPWDYFHHRQQEMMLWFSQHGYNVWFWEPTASLRNGLDISDISATLHLVRTGGFKFERGLRLVNSLNSIIQSKAFSSMLEDGLIDDPIIWFDRVHGVDYGRYLNSYTCIYDLVDEITAFGRFKNRQMLLRIEDRVIEGCDLIVTSSRTLGERKTNRHSVTPLFIPNGCDPLMLHTEASKLPDRHRPTIGFCGTISKRSLDFDLINSVASRLPNFRFVFAGPRDSSAGDIVFDAANIELIDPVPPAELPCLLSTFDVGFIPYRVDSSSMDYVFPKKAFEYMAAGLPVVSTPLPECLRVDGGVSCADSIPGIVEAIIDAVEHSNESVERQKKIASAHTWDVLLPKLESEINKLENRVG